MFALLPAMPALLGAFTIWAELLVPIFYKDPRTFGGMESDPCDEILYDLVTPPF